MNEIKTYFSVNHILLDRVISIKENQNKPIKKGFKSWLKYIRTYKQENNE